MAINTTTFESTLQTKLDDTTLAAKDMLLLGKALEATTGNIAVSDINTAAATKVSEINTAATNTFKTVGGSSILGSGDIAALPAGGTVGQVVTNTGSGAGGWADASGGATVLLQSFTSSSLWAMDFTAFDDTLYSSYEIVFSLGLNYGGSRMRIEFSNDGGASYGDSVSYTYHYGDTSNGNYVSGDVDTGIYMPGDISTSTYKRSVGIINIMAANVANTHTTGTFHIGSAGSSLPLASRVGSFMGDSTFDAVRVQTQQSSYPAKMHGRMYGRLKA